MSGDHGGVDLQLRQLGRVLAEEPGEALMARAKQAACAAMARRANPHLAREVRRWVLAVIAIFAASLPFLGFVLWLDWAATSAILRSFCSPRVTAVCAGLYMWLKISLLGSICMVLAPWLIALALRLHVRDDERLAVLGPEG
jgi:hypothetical protein